jgi:polyphosphate kinase
VTAPFQLHRRMLAHIEQVARRPRAPARPARIVAKINALTDPALIEALVRRQPGRRPHRPDRARRLHAAAGRAGHSENIRVRSVVGRFLEHTRMLYFRWGERRRRRSPVPEQRRLDEPQHVPPHRGGLAAARPGLRQRVIDEAWCPTCTTARRLAAGRRGPLPRVAERGSARSRR